jgi:hypothetical protein
VPSQNLDPDVLVQPAENWDSRDEAELVRSPNVIAVASDYTLCIRHDFAVLCGEIRYFGRPFRRDRSFHRCLYAALREAFPWAEAPKHLIRDRDRAFAPRTPDAFVRWASAIIRPHRVHRGRMDMLSG